MSHGCGPHATACCKCVSAIASPSLLRTRVCLNPLPPCRPPLAVQRSAPKPTGELADEGEEEELIDPYGTVPGADGDGAAAEEPEEFVPAFEATHDEEIAPDYMNIFENSTGNARESLQR